MDCVRIIELHGKLAGRIKEYESQLNISPPNEVSNEMRYALRAVMQILELKQDGNTNFDKFPFEEQKAYHALICAYHDLLDGLAIDLATFITTFTEDYLESSIAVLNDKRMEIIDFLHDVNEIVKVSREDMERRVEIYEDQLYAEYFDKLVGYKKFLMRTALPAVINHHRKAKEDAAEIIRVQKKERIKYSVALAVSVGGLVIGFFTL